MLLFIFVGIRYRTFLSSNMGFNKEIFIIRIRPHYPDPDPQTWTDDGISDVPLGYVEYGSRSDQNARIRIRILNFVPRRRMGWVEYGSRSDQMPGSRS